MKKNRLSNVLLSAMIALTLCLQAGPYHIYASEAAAFRQTLEPAAFQASPETSDEESAADSITLQAAEYGVIPEETTDPEDDDTNGGISAKDSEVQEEILEDIPADEVEKDTAKKEKENEKKSSKEKSSKEKSSEEKSSKEKSSKEKSSKKKSSDKESSKESSDKKSSEEKKSSEKKSSENKKKSEGLPAEEAPPLAGDDVVTPEEIAEAPEIAVGGQTDVYVTLKEPCRLFLFVPQESGSYRFFTEGEGTDTYGELYDENGVKVAENDDVGEEDANCSIDYACLAGKKYCLRVRHYSYGELYFSLRLEKNEASFQACPACPSFWYLQARESVTLSVSAYSNTPLTYQWNRFGADIPDSNSDSFTVEADQAGMVSCTVTDQEGNTETCFFEIMVDNHLKAFPEGAESDAEKTISTKPGKTIALDVKTSADDTSGLWYEWYQEIDDEKNDTERELIEGVNSPSCEISTDDGTASYVCVVYDQYGSRAEASFRIIVNHLAVYPEGSRKTQTARQIVSEPGQKPVLKVNVSADDKKGLKYRWFQDVNGKRTRIKGADKAEYEVPYVPGPSAYICSVSDKYGNTGFARFEVSVNSLEAWAKGSEDHAQQLDVFVTPGESPVLEVEVSTTTPDQLSYEWYDEENEVIRDAVSSVYEFPAVNSCTTCRCLVSDPYGNSEEVYFSIYPNHLQARPADLPEGKSTKTIVVQEGKDVDLDVEVRADDTSSLTYLWYDDINEEAVPGWDSASVHIEGAAASGSYRCDVCDQYGNISSAVFMVEINHLKAWPEGCEGMTETEVYVEEGETAILRVFASADTEGEIGYRWYDDELADENYDTLQHTAVYQVADIRKNHTWRCHVYDSYANYIDIYFHVCVQNHLQVTPDGEEENVAIVKVYTDEKGKAKLKVDAQADDTHDMQYRWYYEDRSSGSWQEIEGETSRSLKVEVEEASSYRCVVTDRFGNEGIVNYTVYRQ